ncbi:MAG: sodium:alanine symporter family protein [Marinilabiliales bacterium]|nr:MAG: sodium:alanine symporter family protein [Marinilabiliales bacterium]
MLDFLDSVFSWYNNYIGGYLIVAILVQTGIFFTLRFKFLQVTKLGHTINVIRGKYDKKGDKGDVNHFKALTTALSATVGTGNIVGVSLAIYYGGPGALFWMWVTAFFGMMLKLVENTLAFKYRVINSDGSVSGGPMYYIESLKSKIGPFAKIMAVIFAFAAILCSLGTGNMAQSNSMADALLTTYDIPTMWSAILFALLVLLIVVGGLKRIADVTSRLVPIMAIFYFVSAVIVLVVFRENIIPSFKLIVTDAFTGTAAKGGFLGSVFIITLMKGVQRGLFSNEAGQGSSPMAHAAAKTEFPLREGLVASIEPLVDTLIICTLTGLVIISSGAWSSGIEGVGMTIKGFTAGFSVIGIGNWAQHIITVGLLLFAFSTIISWSYYGTRAVQYLFGEKYIKPYYYFYGAFVLLGAIGSIDLVWKFVDMVITFMTIPNLIALLLLTPVMKKEIDKYFDYMKTQSRVKK